MGQEIEMIDQNLGAQRQRHLRRNRTVRPDFKNQAVVFRVLADTSRFHIVRNTVDRGIDGIGIYRSNPLRRSLVQGFVAISADVAAAIAGLKLHFQRGAFFQVRDFQIFVQYFHTRRADNITRGHGHWAFCGNS